MKNLHPWIPSAVFTFFAIFIGYKILMPHWTFQVFLFFLILGAAFYLLFYLFFSQLERSRFLAGAIFCFILPACMFFLGMISESQNNPRHPFILDISVVGALAVCVGYMLLTYLAGVRIEKSFKEKKSFLNSFFGGILFGFVMLLLFPLFLGGLCIFGILN